MRGINEVTLFGFLPRDPETKYTAGGKAITNMTVGCTEWRADKKEEVTEWVRVVLFAKTAENAKDYLKKGSKVIVKGKIQTQNWEDKDGNKRQSTSVMGFQFFATDSKPQDGDAPPKQDTPKQTPEDDDLPF